MKMRTEIWKTLDPLAEEIGLFMAEVIMELEEEETVKVKEHIEIDSNSEFGVSMDIGLQVEKITPKDNREIYQGLQRGQFQAGRDTLFLSNSRIRKLTDLYSSFLDRKFCQFLNSAHICALKP